MSRLDNISNTDRLKLTIPLLSVSDLHDLIDVY
jgi:hypothetical protein